MRSSEWHNIVLSYARDPLDLAFTIIFPEGRKCRACQMFYQSQGEEKLYGVQPVLNDQGAKIVFGRSKVEPVDFIVRWEW